MAAEATDEKSSLLSGSLSSKYDNNVTHGSSALEGVFSWLERSLPKTLYKEENEQRIHLAAFLIRDAVAGGLENPTEGAYLPYQHPNEKTINSISVLCRRLCHNHIFYRVLYATIWLLSLLTFIEPPHWCRGGGPSYDADDATSDLSATENCSLLLSMTGPAATVDGGVDESLIVEYYPNAKVGRDGCSFARYLRPGRAQYARIIQMFCVILITFSLGTGYTKFNPFLRLILLGTYIESLQQECLSMVEMFWDIMSIFVFYMLVVLFYAGFGTVAFYESEQGAAGFENFLEALWTLWICITTANYPDVMMPSYNQNRLSALYFVSFMIISFFFFMNLITSRISNKYGSIEDDREDDKKANSENMLKEAFDLMDLDKKGEIDKETIMKLFTVLNEDFPSVRKLDHTNVAFQHLDKDGSGSIDLGEFMQLNDALICKFVKKTEYVTSLEVHFPSLTNSPFFQGLRRTISSQSFDNIIDAVLVLNGVAVIVQTYPMLAGEEVVQDTRDSNGKIDTWWELLEAIFAVIYVLEMVLKLTVWGWKRYMDDQRNVFDFTITVSAVVGSIYVYYPNDYNDANLLRVLVGLRMFRLIRLLTARKQFRDLGVIITNILPRLYHFFIVYYFLLYFFTVAGVVLYGGMISRNPNDDLAYLVLDTEFSNNEYWANNFNDAVSGMNVLFNLLVINNWTECEEGYEAVTEGKYVRWFFLIFHVVGVIFVNNIILGWFIDNVGEQVQELEGHDANSNRMELTISTEGAECDPQLSTNASESSNSL